MKVTMRTIAKQAGVSVPTVSRVLNSPEQVKPETREKVMHVIRSLNFRPNAIARNLRAQQSRTIGVIIPQIRDYFFNELYQGIYKAATESGFNILLFDAQMDPERVMEGFSFLKEQQAEGIIFTSSYISNDYYTMIARVGLPVILTLTESPWHDLAAFKVDEQKAAFDAMSYLVARGHRKIGVISGPLESTIAGQHRYDGYMMAIKHYQLPFDKDQLAFGDFRYESGYRAMETILSHAKTTGITAVCVASDEMAIGAMRAVYDHHLRVPEDISVIGFDNLSISDMVTPKLTTVAQPFEQIGYEAVSALITKLEGGGNTVSNGAHNLSHQIISRESVANYAYDDS